MPLEADELEFLDEESQAASLGEQAVGVMTHLLLAIGAWVAMMAAITLARPDNIPVAATLVLSFSFPFLVGNTFCRFKPSETATYTWLIGLIWFLIVCLWILDMPTGPNLCYHCDASQKIYLTFFSLTEDSGLIDNEGRLLGTWPAVAFIGYGIGARLALKKKSS